MGYISFNIKPYLEVTVQHVAVVQVQHCCHNVYSRHAGDMCAASHQLASKL
jgi:hypothetical protein